MSSSLNIDNREKIFHKLGFFDEQLSKNSIKITNLNFLERRYGVDISKLLNNANTAILDSSEKIYNLYAELSKIYNNNSDSYKNISLFILGNCKFTTLNKNCNQMIKKYFEDIIYDKTESVNIFIDVSHYFE